MPGPRRDASESDAELTRFPRIALGSATELEFQLRIGVRLALLDATHATALIDACLTVQRMLTPLIVKIRPAPDASRGRPKAEKPKVDGRSYPK
jgi:hypothetical protein